MIINSEIRYLKCQLCKSDEAVFQEVEFAYDKVYFHFSCHGCGETWHWWSSKQSLKNSLIAFLRHEAVREARDLKTYLVKLFIFSGNNQQFIQNFDGYTQFCREASKQMQPKKDSSWWRKLCSSA